MNQDEVSKEIEIYLKRVSRVLPDSFETDDLIEDIRAHIMESLRDKKSQHPTTDSLVLVKQVLDALGRPEDIAVEWGKSQHPLEDEVDEGGNQWIWTILKQTIAVIAVVAAAWFISNLPNSIVDFWTALIIMMIFVIAEYFLRTWQKLEVSRIDADVEKKL